MPTHIGLGAQLLSHLCPDQCQAYHMHGHGRHYNARRPRRLYADLHQNEEVSKQAPALSMWMVLIPRIFHFPVTGQK